VALLIGITRVMSDTPKIYNLSLQPGESRLCIDPWAKVVISANGDVNLCCYTTKVGNLRDGSLEEIINGELAKQYREGLLTGNPMPLCRSCGDKPACSISQLKQKVDDWFEQGSYFI